MKSKKLQALVIAGLTLGSVLGVNSFSYAASGVWYHDNTTHNLTGFTGDYSDTWYGLATDGAKTIVNIAGPVNMTQNGTQGYVAMVPDTGSTINMNSTNNSIIVTNTNTNNSINASGIRIYGEKTTVNFNGGSITTKSLGGSTIGGSGHTRCIDSAGTSNSVVNITGPTTFTSYSNCNDETEAIFASSGTTVNVLADSTMNVTGTKSTTMAIGPTGTGIVNIGNGAVVKATVTGGVRNMTMGVGVGSGGATVNQAAGTSLTVDVTGPKNRTYGIYVSPSGTYNGNGVNDIAVHAENGIGIYVNRSGKAIFTNDLTINATTALRDAGTSNSCSIIINKDGGSKVQITGDMINTASGANTIDVTLDNANSYLTGLSAVAATDNTTLNLSNGAPWNVTGTSSLTNLVNNSTVNMRYTGNSTNETITAANLSGNGNYIMNTDLQASYDSKDVQSNGDKIIITTSSTGNNILDLRDVSLDKKLASQGYLLLVEDRSNGGATFTGKDLDHGGIFRYRPVITTTNPTDYSSFNASAKNWYLTGFEKLIEVSDNTKATLGLSGTRYANYFMDNDTLLKRLGELRGLKGEPEQDGIWARYRHGGMDGDGFSGGSSMVQVGYDKKTSNKRYTGLAFNHTSNTYDFDGGATGEGSQDALTVYNTWLGDKNHYFDIVGKIGKMRGNSTYIDSLYPEKGHYDSWYCSISGEYGRKNIDRNGWYYEPQAQLTLGRIRGNDYTTGLGTRVNMASITSLISRAGVTFGKEYNMKDANTHSNIYGKINWLHEFKGDVHTGLLDTYGDSYDHEKDYGGSWWNAGIGATINVNKNTHMYLDFEKNFGGEVTTNWIGQLGCQWTWK
jgi:outer membrane autotransporter protein